MKSDIAEMAKPWNPRISETYLMSCRWLELRCFPLETLWKLICKELHYLLFNSLQFYSMSLLIKQKTFSVSLWSDYKVVCVKLPLFSNRNDEISGYRNPSTEKQFLANTKITCLCIMHPIKYNFWGSIPPSNHIASHLTICMSCQPKI